MPVWKEGLTDPCSVGSDQLMCGMDESALALRSRSPCVVKQLRPTDSFNPTTPSLVDSQADDTTVAAA